MLMEKDPERMAFEKMDVERLEKFVGETVMTMAASTCIRPEEVLDILESIRVEMVGELKGAVETLGKDREAVKRMDSAKLCWEIEKAIEAISVATDLDTDEITTIFSSKPGANLADVAFRLHAQSAQNRATF
jgi:hypothetical protein